jgi:hypothetical protein
MDVKICKFNQKYIAIILDKLRHSPMGLVIRDVQAKLLIAKTEYICNK